MSASGNPPFEDKVVDVFVACSAYAILSLILIMLANEVWYWGNASAPEVQHGMSSAIWVVLVRLAAFALSGLLKTDQRKIRKLTLFSIGACIGSGTLMLLIMHGALGPSSAPGYGILMLDNFGQVFSLLTIGSAFWWKHS